MNIRIVNKNNQADSGLNFTTIKFHLKQKHVWLILILPLFMDAVSITISVLFLPEYIDHVVLRAGKLVAFDLSFVFINSLLYGIIFHKTNNVYISALSHFSANLFSIIVFSFI
jgi:hypothetical protein